MADDEAVVGKMMRPNDLHSAAYYGDIKKLKELLHVEPVEDDPPFDEEFDPLGPVDEEAEEAAKERDARRKANDDEQAKRLAAPNTIVTRLSPVNVKHFGIGMLVSEKDLRCTVQFKPAAKSAAKGTPLHWAVLGKEHEAVEYLLLMGADVNAKVTEIGVTVEDILQRNDLRETRKAVERGVEARRLKVAAMQGVKDGRKAELDRRAKLRQDAQDEVKRKEDEERRAEEAEARAADDAAAAEAAGNAAPDAADAEDDE